MYLLKYYFLFLFIVFSNSSVYALDQNYKPPGHFHLMFNAFRMYIQCEGEGQTPIIIETGIGDTLANWLPIQKELSQYTKVCVYDRAGNGLSDPGPGPRTVSQITFELYNLLKKEKIDGPYMLIGHSFGGYIVQFFAHAFPEEVAGILLVESSHPDQIERLSILDKMKDKPKHYLGGYKFEDLSVLTREQLYWKHLNAQRKAVWTQMDELKSFKVSANELKRIKEPLPSIPLAVLSRGISQLPTIEAQQSLENIWQDMQKDLTNLSNQSWQVIAKKSGHSIHQESPEVIVKNSIKILELIKQN